MFDHADLDEILLLQLTVARLGEKELMNWWNTDIAYQHGGYDFLTRLVGAAFAPLAAGEGILLAARLKEEPLLAAARDEALCSLFLPEPSLRTALAERYRHFKTYPDDLPETLRAVLDPTKDFKAPELLARLESSTKAEFQGTSFGRLVTLSPTASPKVAMHALAATFTLADKGRYAMPYYRSAHAD
ncbi:MAG: BREX-6 system BrxE protein [Spirochaetales bacterium]